MPESARAGGGAKRPAGHRCCKSGRSDVVRNVVLVLLEQASARQFAEVLPRMRAALEGLGFHSVEDYVAVGSMSRSRRSNAVSACLLSRTSGWQRSTQQLFFSRCAVPRMDCFGEAPTGLTSP